MQSLNHAQILGNLTRDPELRTTPNGRTVCSFGVATNRRWTNQDGQAQEDVQFHNIVAWGKLAEIVAQIFKKGNRIYLDGRLQTSSWEAPDGTKRSRTEIVMENFVPLTPKESPEYSEGNNSSQTSSSRKTQSFAKSTSASSKAKSKPKKGGKTKKSSSKESPSASDEDIDLDDIPF